MCASCGCGTSTHEHDPRHGHAHGHGHAHEHAHAHEHGEPHAHPSQADEAEGNTRTLRFERALLAKNDALAQQNRTLLQGSQVRALNLIGAPGAGKTALLEATIRALHGTRAISVVEGDQATARDADRIRGAGAPVVQINTGSGCHLDAQMIARVLPTLEPRPGSLLFIENVGNLVCPALFDLGEQAKVVVMAVTEGEDKPLKYPQIFRAASALVVTKLDLLPYAGLNLRRCIENALQVQPKLRVFSVCATRGEGMDAWCAWLSRAPTE